jgi:TolA-binding protein
MSEKQLTKLQGSELALGVQFSAGIGKEKSLVLTAGVPLDMPYAGINAILDKIAAAIDRQELKYRLRDMTDFIEKCEGDLERNRVQLATYRSAVEATFSVSGRKGEFQPTGRQKAELDNYSNSETHLIAQIRKLREQADDMRKKIEKVEA